MLHLSHVEFWHGSPIAQAKMEDGRIEPAEIHNGPPQRPSEPPHPKRVLIIKETWFAAGDFDAL
jgi:hypothetical protein